MVWDAEAARKKVVNEARVASINAKYEAVQKNKLQIQNALKNINTSKASKNHICFDSDSDEEDAPKLDSMKDTKQKTGDSFLGLDSDENEDIMTIKIKEQFEGRKGHKLMEAQARIGKDSRFQLDKRFQSDDESDCESSSSDESEDDNKPSSELTKNLSILNDVLGVKQQSSIVKPINYKAKFRDQTKLRYDPNQKESKALELAPKKKTEVKNKTVVQREENEPEIIPGKFVEASYTSLKETFDISQKKSENKSESQPFSFASMFSSENMEAENQMDVKEETYFETIENSNEKFNKLLQQPSRYSSSESEDEEEMETENVKTQLDDHDEKPKSFFINLLSDQRIVDGLHFFISNKTDEEIRKDWMTVRGILTEEYRKKQKDARRRIKHD